MLETLRAELRTLPDYYMEAQAAMNATLVKKFRESVAGSGGAVRLNEFVFLNQDRVFSWKQLKSLFAELGSKNPDNSARNYRKGRKGHHMITDKDFRNFIEMIDASIESWVKNDTKLNDFFNSRNGAIPDESTGAPF